MYKNQLQELAQRSCFNLPSYTCIREGPDHAPRFKATVNFNGETFESPHHCSTLRQAEHSAAELALNSLATRSPSHSLAARILDETGVYKNLLQEIAQRVGAPLPQYTTYRSGLGHLPVFTGTVELAGIIFTGEPAKNKKQAEKNAALAAWTSLKQLAKAAAAAASFSSSETEHNDELEQITIARALLNYRLKEKVALANSPNGSIPFTMKFPSQSPLRLPTSPQQPQSAPPTSKILPLICQRSSPRNHLRHPLSCSSSSSSSESSSSPLDCRVARPHKFPAPGAAPYVPYRPFRMMPRGMAPPVTIRNAIPVFSAPPPPPVRMAQPVCVRQAVPVFAAPPPPPKKDDKDGPQQVTAEASSLSPLRIAPPPPVFAPGAAQKKEGQVTEKESTMAAASVDSPAVEDVGKKTDTDDVAAAVAKVVVVQDLKELKI